MEVRSGVCDAAEPLGMIGGGGCSEVTNHQPRRHMGNVMPLGYPIERSVKKCGQKARAPCFSYRCGESGLF